MELPINVSDLNETLAVLSRLSETAEVKVVPETKVESVLFIINEVAVTVLLVILLIVSDTLKLDKALVPERSTDGMKEDLISVKFSEEIVVEIFCIAEKILLEALAGVGDIESTPKDDISVDDDGIPLHKDEGTTIGDSDIVTKFMASLNMDAAATVLDILSATFDTEDTVVSSCCEMVSEPKLDKRLEVIKTNFGCCVAADIMVLATIDEADVAFADPPEELTALLVVSLPLVADSDDITSVV